MLNVLFENIDFCVELILIFAEVKRWLEFLNNLKMGVEEQTFTEVL